MDDRVEMYKKFTHDAGVLKDAGVDVKVLLSRIDRIYFTIQKFLQTRKTQGKTLLLPEARNEI